MFQLIHKINRVSLHSGESILVGRGEHCDLQIEDPSVSRVHCRMLSRDGRVFLTDASSRWGTFINGERVEECELKPGDDIQLGDTHLELHAKAIPNDTTLARRSQLQRREGVPSHRLENSFPEIAQPVEHFPAKLSDQTRAARRLHAGNYLDAIFAGYRIKDYLQETQSGLLFRAEGPQGTVALKLFQPSIFMQESKKLRFLRAIEKAGQLVHPNLVTLYTGGAHGDILYTVSEFVQGESAADLIRRIGVAGMLDWRNTLKIAQGITAALEFIEEQGILHRNILPQHILIGRDDGRVKLNDLLLSKTLGDERDQVTHAGELVGELPYLPPEQLSSGHRVDWRSDIYQLGATLYALLTGQPPFQVHSTAALIDQILNTAPVPPTRKHLSIPALFEGTVLTMLEKSPHRRFSTARDLRKQLERIREFTI